jgi:hypothetical protein
MVPSLAGPTSYLANTEEEAFLGSILATSRLFITDHGANG